MFSTDQLLNWMVWIVLGLRFLHSNPGVSGALWALSRQFVQVGFTVSLFAGVSNWGGYAIACALHVLRCCDTHERFLRRALGRPRPPSQRPWLPALPSVPKVPLGQGWGCWDGEMEVASSCWILPGLAQNLSFAGSLGASGDSLWRSSRIVLGLFSTKETDCK